jgi:hypothetical protein
VWLRAICGQPHTRAHYSIVRFARETKASALGILFAVSSKLSNIPAIRKSSRLCSFRDPF